MHESSTFVVNGFFTLYTLLLNVQHIMSFLEIRYYAMCSFVTLHDCVHFSWIMPHNSAKIGTMVVRDSAKCAISVRTCTNPTFWG